MEQSVYSANETARIIGKQTILDIVGGGAIAVTDINAIIDAHRAAGHSLANVQLALDLFALGLIYGKKIERARRNGGKVQPIATPQVGGHNLNADTTRARSKAAFIAIYARSAASAANKRAA